MAGHLHHNRRHHHSHQNHETTCCSSALSHGCSFNCDSICNQTPHYHPPPPLPSVDPFLESLAAHELCAQSRRFHGLQNPNKRFNHSQQQQHQRRQRQEDQRSTDLLISSLVSRIDALEASLSHFPPVPSRSREGCDRRRWSLREAAARVIQTHFRAFLVRRSRALGQLRELAVVKSGFSSLRSSISDPSNVDLYGVARKAVDLLVKLDSIQGNDSMVRDGKRSISKDLVRFLEFVEGVSVKRHELYLKERKNNARVGQNSDKRRVFLNRESSDLDLDRREIIGKLKERVEKIRGYTKIRRNDDEDVVLEGFQHVSDDGYDEEFEEEEELEEEENPVVVIREKSNPNKKNGVLAKKKSVSFAENRNVLKLFSNSNEPGSNEDGDSTTSSEDRSRDVEEIKVFSLGTEDDGDEDAIVVNKASRREDGVYEIRGRFEGRDGEFLLSAPLPVQMDEKADSFGRRNGGKVLR